MNRHLSVIVPGLLLVIATRSFGVPASPQPFTVTQPDGTAITLHVRGDEYFNWFEDVQGYTVVLDRGNYVYAQLDAAKQLAPTKYVVGRTDAISAGFAKGVLPTLKLRTQRKAELNARDAQPETNVQNVPPIGTVKNLVVLCKFSDHVFGTHTRPRGDYDVLFNTIGGDPTIAPTGSVRDCFTENSYGQMTLDSTVAEWVTLPQTEAYYADGQYGFGTYPQEAAGMVEDALDLLDATVDFGNFDTDNDGYIDAITIVHSGYDGAAGGGPNSIWSHRGALSALPGGQWTSSDVNGLGELVKVYDYHTEPALRSNTGTGIVRIGVFVHETGHFFDLPDLYDTSGGGSGIGSYCMMANSWGFDNSGMNPPHFSAWSKVFLGWVAPTVISTPGVYTAPQVQTTPTVFRVDLNYPFNEYLLIENRQPVGFDSQMPQGGLCVWHIDEIKPGNTDQGFPGQPGWPENNSHYMVALLQADGNYDLEHGSGRGDAGDVYHAAGVSAVGEFTVPNTDAYQLGDVYATHNEITNITAAAPSMDFTYNGFLDCNRNGTPDDEDISIGPSLDCQPNGIPDECESDCQPNGVPDDCDIANETSNDCNTNDVPDECETAAGGTLINESLDGGLPGGWSASGIFQITNVCGLADPNCGGSSWAYAGNTDSCTHGDGEIGDLISPSVSLGYGRSELRFCSRVDTEVDFDFAKVLVNGVEVWLDSGDSGGWVEEVIDLTSFAGQTVTINFQFVSDGAVSGTLGWQVDNVNLTTEDLDANDNGIPDDCEGPPDCNNNGIDDAEDIANLTSLDCQPNGIPDECELDASSMAPGGPFFCDPSSLPVGLVACDPDCNDTGTPDDCELADNDCNSDGRPDDCSVIDVFLWDLETFPAALNTNAASDSSDDHYPQLTTDGEGNWLAVWHAHLDGTPGIDYDILFSRSTDNGASWNAPAALNSNAASDSGWDSYPQLTTDGQGNWLAVWYSNDDLGGTIGTDRDIFFSHSTDNGVSWTSPAALNSNAASDSGWDGDPQLTTDGQGNWLAVWVSEDDLGGTIGTDSDILFSTSTDNGASWTTPMPLNTNAASDSGNEWFPQLTTDGQGNWLAVWSSYDDLGGTIGTDPDILFCRSTDNGASWTAPGALNSNAASDSGWDWYPELTTDGQGNWLAVWYSVDDLGETIGTDMDILVSRSTDNGASWTAPAALNTNAASDSGYDSNPQLTVDGRGNWLAVWFSNEDLNGTIGGDEDILYSVSTNSGANWTSPAALNTNGASAYPQLTTDGEGNWLAVWHSRDALGGTIGTDWDILFSQFRSVDNDCNDNGVPDDCEMSDCNENCVDDADDIANLTSPDCNENNIPDECDISDGAPDCNANGVPDDCDLADCSGDPTCDDCNENSIPDECDLADCSGEPACDDCNENSTPDACDIAGGAADNNANNIPDECEVEPPVLPVDPKHQARKNRYISIDPTTSGPAVAALLVELTSMKRCIGDDRRACITDADCPGICAGNHDLQCADDGVCGSDGPCTPTDPCVEHSSVGVTKWVDEPVTSACVPLSDCAGQWFAGLVDTAVYRVWTEDTVHIADCTIIPAAEYEIRATANGTNFTDALTIGTITKPNVHYGDCVGQVIAGAYTPADGFTNVTDVQAYLIANQGGASAPHTTWVDLHSSSSPVVPQQILNVGDLQTIKFGFLGQTYVETPGHENPGDCP